jgi:2-C-methyl-D-erythritol 4-phosphate cytidylyltransferase
VPLGGRPIFLWSIDLMTRAGCDPIILTLPPAALEEGSARLDPNSNVMVTEGGSTRQESVALGLAHVTKDAVVVHDAARPFATERMVHSVVNELEAADGAIAAIRVGDAVKREGDASIKETVSRDDLWLAQTPQAFATDVLRAAHRRAADEGYVAGDDAELVERYGGRVTMIQGSSLNIKITFQTDYRLAEAIASAL